MNWNALKALQHQLLRAVLPEQPPRGCTAGARDAPMARLDHDRPLGARDRQTGHMARVLARRRRKEPV